MSKKTGPRAPYIRKRRNDGMTWSTNVPATVVRFGSTSGTYVTSYENRGTGHTGVLEECTDVVTPGFSKLMAEGRVINNPFAKVRATLTSGGTGPSLVYKKATSPWPSGAVKSYTAEYLHRGLSPMMLVPPLDEFGGLVGPNLSMIDVPYLIKIASTGALAKVDQSTAQGITTLGELKSTLKLITNPLAAVGIGVQKHISILNSTASRHGQIANVHRLVSRTATKLGTATAGSAYASNLAKSHVALTRHLVNLKQQRSLSRYGRNVLATLSNQYLAMYYGLKPLLSEIEGLIQAYIDEGHTHERQRAVSGADKTAFRIEAPTSKPGALSSYVLQTTTTEECSVRKGILYIPTESSYQRAFGFRFGDLPAGVYDLVPWTFMFDYFTNLGKLVRALSPRYGVEYLATWTTAKASIKTRVECVSSTAGADWTMVRPSTEWCEMLLEATLRTPSNPYADIGPAMKVSDFGTAKVGAIIALITQAFLA